MPGSKRSADGLLSKRKAEGDGERFLRMEAAIASRDEPFLLKKSDFGDQYFSVYCQRLETLRPVLSEVAQSRWNDPNVLLRTIDLRPEQSVTLIGTLVKELKLLPTVLQQYTKERAINAIPQGVKFLNQEDKIWIEDESGRIQLLPQKGTWETSVHSIPHGSVVAVRGKESEGILYVDDFCIAGLPPQAPLPEPTNEGRFLAIVSGLADSSPLERQMMLNYMEGHLGGLQEQEDVVRRIVRVVVAGDSFPPRATPDRSLIREQLKEKQDETAEKQNYINLLRDLDIDISELASCVDVDMMPGASDPTNLTLPHQPLSSCLFPLASKLSSFHLVPAPHGSVLGEGTFVLGSSGEEIESLSQFTDIVDPLETAYQLLSLRHLAPTAPNTLAAYPSETEDPFILHESPHVFFFGNQASFASKLFTGPDEQRVRIVSVPRFSVEPTIALVNIDTLDCFPVHFSAQL